MDKYNWYFKQPVSEFEMDTAFGWVQTFLRNMLSEGRQPFGITSGYTPSPVVGELSVLINSGIAFDQQGRRIYNSSNITQSLATTTAGVSTAVTAPENERYVSVIARGGYSFIGAAVDGSGNNVRTGVYEVLNSLGEGTHGVGNYDPDLAFEDGVNAFLILMSDEAEIGTATRPFMPNDGVLICDIRLTNGMTELHADDIKMDRRKELVPAAEINARGELALHSWEEGQFKVGVVQESLVQGGPSLGGGISIFVQGGQGYIQQEFASGLIKWDLNKSGVTGHRVHIREPHPTYSRQDLLIINESGLSVLPGDPGSSPVPPAVPAFALPLAEIRVLPATTESTVYPMVRRTFRNLPFPYSTMTGIIEGCRLRWDWPTNTLASSPPKIVSKRNKVSFDGEVVEFFGSGIFGGRTYLLEAHVDTGANPFGSSAPAGSHRPYFIYVCRKQFEIIADNGGDPGVAEVASPVCLIESMIAPDADTGRPEGNLTGPRGTISPEDALVIGIGWVRYGTTNRCPVLQSDDNWFFIRAKQDLQPVNSMSSASTLYGAPQTDLVDRAKILISGLGEATYTTPFVLAFTEADQSAVSANSRYLNFPNIAEQGSTMEWDVVAVRGRLGVVVTSVEVGENMWISPTAFHINLPRIGHGGSH